MTFTAADYAHWLEAFLISGTVFFVLAAFLVFVKLIDLVILKDKF